MKIVAISASQVPSHTANSVQAMKAVHALAQLGHEVTLVVPAVTPANGNQAFEWEKLAEHYGLSQPFKIHRLATSQRRMFAFQAVNLASTWSPDLLYVWPLQSAALAGWKRLPVLLEMHDLPSGRFGPFWFRLFLWARSPKRLAVITSALESALRAHYKTLPPTILAPNGVDYERFAEIPDAQVARAGLGLPERPTILCAGNLYAGRGTDLFLHLAARLPQAHFLWVGGSEQEALLWQENARKCNLLNVTFTGFVPHIYLPLYHAAADVLLMPYGKQIGISSGGGHSARFSSPMKMFEYLASGRPILVSDLPVFREVLDDTLAIFCPPEQAETWEQALKALLNDPERCQTLASRSRQAAQKFSWTARAARLLASWEQEP